MNRIWAALGFLALSASSAQALASARLTASPGPGQSLRAGSTTTLQFAVDGKINEMEVLLSLDGGQTFPLRVTRERSAGTLEMTWRVPNLPTKRARLALRVGDKEKGEVIRDVSEEFTILAADTEPLENSRPFRGEWRLGEALEEIPSTAPFDAPGLAGTTESICALRHETDLDRTSPAALTGTPPDGDPEAVEPMRPDRVSTPASPRIPRNLPKRE